MENPSGNNNISSPVIPNNNSCHSIPNYWGKSAIPYDIESNDIDPEVYLDLVLKPTTYIIKSFAFGGLPYFEKSEAYNQEFSEIIDFIKKNEFNEVFNQFFRGLEPSQIGDKLICHVTDSRYQLDLKYSITLKKLKKSNNENHNNIY